MKTTLILLSLLVAIVCRAGVGFGGGVVIPGGGGGVANGATSVTLGGTFTGDLANFLTYTTNYLYAPDTHPFVTNIINNYDTNIYFFRGAGTTAYNNVPFVWNPTLAGWTNSTLGFNYNSGDASFEAGSAPISGINSGNADYYYTTANIATNLSNVSWTEINGSQPDPVGDFKTNSITTNILVNTTTITTNRFLFADQATNVFLGRLHGPEGSVSALTDIKFLLPPYVEAGLSKRFWFSTNTAFLSTNGNDGTGTRGNPALPFVTLAAAYNAISTNGCIWFIGRGQTNNLAGTQIFSKAVTLVLPRNRFINGTFSAQANLTVWGGELDDLPVNMSTNGIVSFHYVRMGDPAVSQNIDCFVGAGTVWVQNCALFSVFDAFNNLVSEPLNIFMDQSLVYCDEGRNLVGSTSYARCINNTPTTSRQGFVSVKNSTLIAVGSTTSGNVNLYISNGIAVLENVVLIGGTNALTTNLVAGAGGTIYLDQTRLPAGTNLNNGGQIIAGFYRPSIAPGGTIAADNVVAGIVGEYTNKLVASGAAISLSSATAANVTNLTLAAGDWEVSGNVNFALSGATTTAFSAGINTTSATLPTDGSECYSAIITTVLTDTETITIPRKRINVASTTTVYLVGKSTFSVGSETIFGSLTARRVR